MNDNIEFAYHEEAYPSNAREKQDRQLALGKPLAIRAIRDPKGLSIDEIKDMAWTLLVATRRLDDLERGLLWDIS